MPKGKSILITAAIALGVVYAYHKAMLPGLKDAKKIETTPA